MIEINDNGNGRSNSWSATYRLNNFHPYGGFKTHFIGYGKNEEEARMNLARQLRQFRAEISKGIK